MTEWLSLSGPSGRREVPALSVRIDSDPGEASVEWGILYLHGFGSSHSGEKADFFRGRARALGIPICSFDFQGHGQSGGGMRGLTLTRNLEDVERVRSELGVRGWDRVVILGSSLGGLTGLWYSALQPERVEAGLYVAPALGLDETFEDWLGTDGVDQWRRDGVLRVENELGSWDLGWSFLEDFRSYPDHRLVEALSTPSLLLQGQLDDRVPWRRVAGLAEACAEDGVEIRLFEDGDHRLVDRKETLWNLMRDFLAGLGLTCGDPTRPT